MPLLAPQDKPPIPLARLEFRQCKLLAAGHQVELGKVRPAGAPSAFLLIRHERVLQEGVDSEAMSLVASERTKTSL